MTRMVTQQGLISDANVLIDNSRLLHIPCLCSGKGYVFVAHFPAREEVHTFFCEGKTSNIPGHERVSGHPPKFFSAFHNNPLELPIELSLPSRKTAARKATAVRKEITQQPALKPAN